MSDRRHEKRERERKAKREMVEPAEATTAHSS